MNVREYKSYPAKIEDVDGRIVTGISAVMGIEDDGGDVIEYGAFRKTIKERLPRIRHLWQHDFSQPPTAVILELQELPASRLPEALREQYPNATGGLLVRRRYLETPRAEEILQGILHGAITEMSFGYDTIKSEMDKLNGKIVRVLKEIRLWDISDVNWGMNPATVALVKMAVPFADYGIADEERAWSAPTLADFTDETDFASLSVSERKRIREHFAWSAEAVPERFTDLKLPHHEPRKSGVGPANWNGVRAAMAVLNGARGGVDIPADEREAVYRHLARHYEQFGKEPPDLKTCRLIWELQGYRHDNPVIQGKAGELLSLLTAESPETALTDRDDDLRLRLMLTKKRIEHHLLKES
jgi:HK97 family phage prohead protease